MKFLIVKTSSLGDIVQTYPVINYLKTFYPECVIDWVVESSCALLVLKNPNVRRTIEVRTRDWRRKIFSTPTWNEIGAVKRQLQEESYDVIFDLQGNLKSGLITFLANGKRKVGFGYQTVSELPNLLATNVRFNPPLGKNIREDLLYPVQSYFYDTSLFIDRGTPLELNEPEKEQVLQLLDGKNPLSKKLLLVCPGSLWKNKRLPCETLQKVLNDCSQDYFFLFCWGNEQEKTTAERLRANFNTKSLIVPKLPLHQLQFLMSHVDGVFAMDSLPLHLAASVGAKTLSVFGPSSMKKYAPLGERHSSFQGTCPFGVAFEKRCPKLRRCTSGACLRTLSPSDVRKGLSL